MKDIYCKIADWIVSQNIDRSVNSTDIKEIADYVFNVQLKSTGVLKVKECLREKGITVKDAKIKDAFYDPTNNLFEPVVDYIYKNWMTIYSDEYIYNENIIVQNDGSYVFKSKEPNFVYIRFSGSRKEMFLKPYAYSKFYDGLKRIKIDGWKLKTVSKKKVKPKFRPGEEYYEISSITYERNSKPVKDALEMTPLDYIKEALDKEGIEYEINDDIYGFNPPYYASINILDPNDIDLADEIICNIVGYAYQVHRDRYGHKSSFSVATEQEDIDEINGTSLKDKKFKDEKYIVYLNGEPYYTAKSYDEAMRIESQLYSASDTEDDFQAYYGNYPDVEIRKVRDSKIKDAKPILWGAKAYDVEKECWRGFCKYIDTESGEEASKILENEVPFPYSKYRFLGSYNRLPEHFIRLDDSNIKDSKLTRKQKIWYGEELENLIYPQYLRRNYQKRKTRRRKK